MEHSVGHCCVKVWDIAVTSVVPKIPSALVREQHNKVLHDVFAQRGHHDRLAQHVVKILEDEAAIPTALRLVYEAPAQPE
jgi:hypothetical protein